MKRKRFNPGQSGPKFGQNWRPNDVPIQFTPTDDPLPGKKNVQNNFFRGDNNDQGLMGNPLSRYRPMPMEEPITDMRQFEVPSSNSNFFNNKRNSLNKRKYQSLNENPKKIKSKFPSFPSIEENDEDEVMSFEKRFPSNFPKSGVKSRKKAPKRIPIGLVPQRRKTTTPRPIPIPGKDFDFVIPHNVHASPQQPALPVSNPIRDYDRNFYDYDNDGNDQVYDDYEDDSDLGSFGGFDGDDKFSASVGFMNAGFGPSWEPSKLSKRKKRDTSYPMEGRTAASSIFWHNGQPIQPRNRNRKNRRRNRQNVWGDRNQRCLRDI